MFTETSMEMLETTMTIYGYVISFEEGNGTAQTEVLLCLEEPDEGGDDGGGFITFGGMEVIIIAWLLCASVRFGRRNRWF